MSRRVALVTGAATGIGSAISTSLARCGHDVVLHGMKCQSELGERHAASLRSTYGVDTAFVAADLLCDDEALGLVERAKAAMDGRTVGILVNNAGLQHVCPAQDFEMADWHRLLQVNLSASFCTIKSALPEMYKEGFGRIICIASAHSKVASPYKTAYNAAKHGVVGLVKTVALEASAVTPKVDVTCNAVSPGYVNTEMVQSQLENQAKSRGLLKEQVIEEVIVGAHPSKEFVQPEEVGEFVAFLASDVARSFTGANLSMDRGWTAR